MAELRSFRDVIANVFYSEIWNALSKFIEDNPAKLECRSYRVEQPDDAELSNKRCRLRDLHSSKGRFTLEDRGGQVGKRCTVS